MKYISNSREETFELGRSFGMNARPGDIICLDGDLGAGKTVFAAGFAAGLGIDSVITSPTFTIIREYDGGRLPFYHFDVYRIEEPGEMYELGYEEYFFGDGVCLIEWASLIDELIPESAKRFIIKRMPEKDEDFRSIETED